ncbi:hypothetical protein C4097_06825 [Clostridioides difficile]|uniref:hypothetical protein n=1 Tax=Clostridioides sp. ZZV15-6598 TaxID=2811501 RepID=UPI001D0F8163|nr:hypothetical protein [Clostridioides sp. ZZV15-6598]MDB3084273.1 hypothetical protein [Clostridioides difficile]
MRIKKYVSGALVLGLVFVNSSILSFANEVQQVESQSDEAIIQKQLDGFEEIDQELRENGVESTDKDPNIERATSGTYPTRIGAILVTKDGKFGKLIGHAGIVHTATTTVESFPEGGVKVYNNNWRDRYNSVYGLGVRKTTTAQDKTASTWAYNKRTLPYNWVIEQPELTNAFYCSQLVYKAYKSTAGVNLNYEGGAVFPYDLVKTGETYTSYTKNV